MKNIRNWFSPVELQIRIRHRENIPTTWIEISITEGKNRQVRRMCAAVGYPVLRLIRVSIGDIKLAGIAHGKWKHITIK